MNSTTLTHLPHLPLGQMSEIELVNSGGPSVVDIPPLRPCHGAVLLHTRTDLHYMYM